MARPPASLLIVGTSIIAILLLVWCDRLSPSSSKHIAGIRTTSHWPVLVSNEQGILHNLHQLDAVLLPEVPAAAQSSKRKRVPWRTSVIKEDNSDVQWAVTQLSQYSNETAVWDSALSQAAQQSSGQPGDRNMALRRILLQAVRKEQYHVLSAGLQYCTLHGIHPSNGVWSDIIVLLDFKGSYDLVLEVFLRIDLQKEKSAYRMLTLLNLVMWALKETNNWEEAERHFERYSKNGITPNIKTYTTLLVALKKGQQLHKVAHYFQRMKSDGCKPDLLVFNIVLGVQGLAGDLHGAMETLNSMSAYDVKPDLVSYNSVIGACQAAGEAEQAFAILTRMRDENIEPDACTYTALITVCSVTGLVERSFQLYEEMKSLGLKPDDVTYNALIAAGKNAGQWELAAKYLEEMMDTGFQPDQLTLDTMLGAYNAGAQWQKATILLNDMQTVGYTPTVFSYSTVISSLGKGGQVLQAEDLFDRMQEANVEPNDITYCAIIRGLGRAGRWPEALMHFDDMKKRALAPSVQTFNALVEALFKGGQWERARNLVVAAVAKSSDPLAPRVNAMTFNYVLAAMGEAEQWREGLNLYDVIKASGIIPDALTYTLLLRLCEKCNEWELAVTISQEMISSGHPPELVDLGPQWTVPERKKWLGPRSKDPPFGSY